MTYIVSCYDNSNPEVREASGDDDLLFSLLLMGFSRCNCRV